MPDRKEVFNSIEEVKGNKAYEHLKPRKLVNNFVKVNHRYNYDEDYTSDEEGEDDFIVSDNAEEEDDSSSDSDANSSCSEGSKKMKAKQKTDTKKVTKKKFKQIGNFTRLRSLDMSESSDDDGQNQYKRKPNASGVLDSSSSESEDNASLNSKKKTSFLCESDSDT